MTPSPEMQVLLDEIRAEVGTTRQYTGRAVLSHRVLQAFAEVPRHRFLPAVLRPVAYANHPLPIGHEQTISQPYIVAVMTDLLDLEPDHSVLEIGTGSGYQAAVLAKLVKQVYSLEIVPALAEQAKLRLRELGYSNVEVAQGDGHGGWPEHAPFEAIMVTAAAPEIPPALLEQLKPGGRMLIPVGHRYRDQDLWLIEKDRDGRLRRNSILPVIFVPLTGAAET